MKKRLLLLLIPIALLAGWGIYRLLFTLESTEILLSGNIEATTVEVGFQTGGRIIRLSIEEGQMVEKGQLLSELDSTELAQRESNARTRLAVIQSQIPQWNTSLQLQRRTTQTEIERAQANLAAAQAQLAELRNGARPQEIEQALQAEGAARSRLNQVQLDLQRADALYQAGAQPKKNLDAAQTALELAEAENRRASEALALIREGPRRETIEAAEARVRQSQTLLEQARLSALLVQRLEQQLSSAQAEVENAQSAVNISTTQLGYTRLLSPISGRILSRNAELGEVVGVGSPVCIIADLENVWLRIYLDQADLGKVRLNQKVSVFTDSFPNKMYEGRIAFISAEAEFTPKTIQTQKERVKLVYRLKISLKNENQELKPGMPADAVIAL